MMHGHPARLWCVGRLPAHSCRRRSWRRSCGRSGFVADPLGALPRRAEGCSAQLIGNARGVMRCATHSVIGGAFTVQCMQLGAVVHLALDVLHEALLFAVVLIVGIVRRIGHMTQIRRLGRARRPLCTAEKRAIASKPVGIVRVIVEQATARQRIRIARRLSAKIKAAHTRWLVHCAC